MTSLQDNGHLLEQLRPRAQEKSEPSRQPGSPGDVESQQKVAKNDV